MRHASLALTSLSILIAMTQPVMGQTRVTAIAPYSETPDIGVWYENDVRAGAAASIEDLSGLGGNLENNQPMPVGAARLTTDLTNGAKAEIGVVDAYGTPNDIFASLNLAYEYHKASSQGQNLFAAPSLKLTFYSASCVSGDCYGELIYEPNWNQSNPGTSQQPPLDTWTQVNIDQDSGIFWTSGMFGVPSSFGGPPLRTLAEWLSAFDADFGTAQLIRVSIGVGTYNQGQVGYFDNVSISHAAYSESYDFDVEGAGGQVARFSVTKDFVDNNPTPVEVAISCNSGLPLSQTATISEGSGVTFVVTDFVEGTACEITETDVDSAYEPSYDNGTTVSAESCLYQDVVDGEYSCVITNDIGQTLFSVYLDWQYTDGAPNIESSVDMYYYCENIRTTADAPPVDMEGPFPIGAEYNNPAVAYFYANPVDPKSRCRFDAVAVDSAVELDNGCADWIEFVPGDAEVSCTVTATVFFEGIPTLSQYGMVLLALSMLGIGVLGFRRYA